eukprot:m.110347 g.110347  ORF g.110347 m.110347 type:complete len:388 (+) comp37388_c0_seq4:326-1489(+)
MSPGDLEDSEEKGHSMPESQEEDHQESLRQQLLAAFQKHPENPKILVHQESGYSIFNRNLAKVMHGGLLKAAITPGSVEEVPKDPIEALEVEETLVSSVEEEAAVSETSLAEQSVGSSLTQTAALTPDNFIPAQASIEATVDIAIPYSVGSINAGTKSPLIRDNSPGQQRELLQGRANPLLDEEPPVSAEPPDEPLYVNLPQAPTGFSFSANDAAAASLALTETQTAPELTTSRSFNTFQPTVPFPNDYKSPYSSDLSDNYESIDEQMFETTSKALPSASVSSPVKQTEEKIQTVQKKRNSPEEIEEKRKMDRVALIEECMDALEEMNGESEREKLEILDSKCCNCCLNCCVGCHRCSNSCDCLESCAGTCCPEKEGGKKDFCCLWM